MERGSTFGCGIGTTENRLPYGRGSVTVWQGCARLSRFSVRIVLRISPGRRREHRQKEAKDQQNRDYCTCQHNQTPTFCKIQLQLKGQGGIR